MDPTIYRFDMKDVGTDDVLTFDMPVRDPLTLRMLQRHLPQLCALVWGKRQFLIGDCARSNVANMLLADALELTDVGVRVAPIERDFAAVHGAQATCLACGRMPYRHASVTPHSDAWELIEYPLELRQRLVIKKNPKIRK